MPFAKIDDLENRSKRYNFRIRGLPESIKDVQAAECSFIKDKGTFPDIPDHCLELDRVHRALQPPSSDGLPRDFVTKPHFYRVKEDITSISRDMNQLTIQGHLVQAFADLSPTTIQRRFTQTTSTHPVPEIN